MTRAPHPPTIAEQHKRTRKRPIPPPRPKQKNMNTTRRAILPRQLAFYETRTNSLAEKQCRAGVARLWPGRHPPRQDGYRQLSRLCPHQGVTVEDCGAQFVCHNHGDRDGGTCLNADGLRRKSFVVNVKDGRLIVGAGREAHQRAIGRPNRPADRRCARQARNRRAARHPGRGRVFAPTQGRETAQSWFCKAQRRSPADPGASASVRRISMRPRSTTASRPR
jgi:hypothetical protein